MWTLLKVLLNFWDILCSYNASDNEEFGDKFMGGIITSIQYLLVYITHTIYVFNTYFLTRKNQNT